MPEALLSIAIPIAIGWSAWRVTKCISAYLARNDEEPK